MPPLSLAPGITRIPTAKNNNAFLVEGDDGLTLIDAGMAKAPNLLLAALAEQGHPPTDLRRIVLTHAHPDHVKGAPGLRRRTGAQILIHRADANWLPAGRVPPEGRCRPIGRLLDRLPIAHWPTFEADALLDDGELIEGSGGLRVIHTPGHTPGHIVLLHEPTRSVLAGDAVFNQGRLSLGHDMLAAAPASRPASVARIPDTVTAVGFAHGEPILADGIDTFHAFLRAQRSTSSKRTNTA
ncbi:MBL fold metallo-hydrolase [Streptomyces sp. NPDC001848]|uniref:MBL fold metallo-hydrolase n=1 Tax=Streptomyces sp. NPDC001848 TaxID=3364618 RepID=UPI003685A58D